MPLKCRLTIGEDDKFCYVYFTTIKNKGFILTVGIMYVVHMDFPVAQTVKNLPATEETPGLIPGSGRIPGEGNGCPLQYSCLGTPTDREAWQATVPGVAKCGTRPSD